MNTPITYDPARHDLRHLLAESLLTWLRGAGFEEWDQNDRGVIERVFRREVPGTKGTFVVVYTTIVGYGAGAEVRGVGEDAIRVLALRAYQGTRI